jgi:hypothetical protein
LALVILHSDPGAEGDSIGRVGSGWLCPERQPTTQPRQPSIEGAERMVAVDVAIVRLFGRHQRGPIGEQLLVFMAK